MQNHLVDLDLTEVDNICPPSPGLEVILPVDPVVVEKLPWVGGDTKTEDCDVQLSQQ